MTAQKNFRTDSFLAGLAFKAPCVVATTEAIVLSGEQTVAGVAVTAGDRVLVKDQADPVENGIYTCETSAWQRAGDFDSNRDVVNNTAVLVPLGDGWTFYLASGNTDPVQPGVSEITFAVLNLVTDAVVLPGGGTIGDNEDGDPTFTDDEDNISEFALYPLTNYRINVTTVSSASGKLDLNCEVGNAFIVELDEDIDAVSFLNVPGGYTEIIIRFTQDGTGDWTITGWPLNVKWPGGTVPVITTTASTGRSIVALKTFDGGTSWEGDFSQDYS